MTEQEAIMIIQSIPEKIWNQMDKVEEEAIAKAIDTLEELNLYKENGLCLIPSDVYERQCEELDRLKEKEKLRRNISVDDSLFVGVDFSPNDEDVVVVMRNMNNHIYVVNMIKNEEAREVYNKLIGVKYECHS